METIRISENLRNLLERCKGIDNNISRQIAIASVITQIFLDNDKEPPILVGGMAAAVYSYGQYATLDTDFVSREGDFGYEVLRCLGYLKLGKDYFNKELSSYIEIPSDSLTGSYDRIFKYFVEETQLYVYLIGIEDIILDRAGSYVSTNDQNSKEWALKLMGGFYSVIDWSYLHKTAHELGMLKSVEKLQREVKRYKDLYRLIEGQDETSSHLNEDITKMKLF